MWLLVETGLEVWQGRASPSLTGQLCLLFGLLQSVLQFLDLRPQGLTIHFGCALPGLLQICLEVFHCTLQLLQLRLSLHEGVLRMRQFLLQLMQPLVLVLEQLWTSEEGMLGEA